MSETKTPAAAAGSDGAAIVVERLTKVIAVGFWGRKKTLISDVSFRVERGRTVGFVGPNGAGKSTTIKHLIGASSPTSGSVRVMGVDPRAHRARVVVGHMPELPQLPPTLNPVELCRLHATLCGVAETRGQELLDVVGLRPHARERIGVFSKGMQTRLSLALALLHRPSLLILDEPMSGLDPVGRRLVRQILHEEAERGTTILFSSHVLSDVEALCDDVVVISQGRVVFAGGAAAAVGDGDGSWRLRVRTREVDKPPTVAAEVTARREGDTWLLSSTKDGLELAAALRAQGVDVLEVARAQPSLEDRLLAFVGGSSS